MAIKPVRSRPIEQQIRYGGLFSIIALNILPTFAACSSTKMSTLNLWNRRAPLLYRSLQYSPNPLPAATADCQSSSVLAIEIIVFIPALRAKRSAYSYLAGLSDSNSGSLDLYTTPLFIP